MTSLSIFIFVIVFYVYIFLVMPSRVRDDNESLDRQLRHRLLIGFPLEHASRNGKRREGRKRERKRKKLTLRDFETVKK